MGPRRVTIATIAEQAGVHRSTVSLALRDDPRLPVATRERIKGIARDLGYKPNHMARGLAGRSTDTVGILIPGLRDDFYARIVAAQQEYLLERGMCPLLFAIEGRDDTEIEIIEDLASWGADGMVFDYTPNNAEMCAREAGKPVTFMGDEKVEYGDSIFYNNRAAARALFDHLLELGHRRIAIVIYSDRTPRLEAYKEALAEAGIEYDPSLVFYLVYEHKDLSWLVHRILDMPSRPTAVFAYNDDLAAELVHGFVTLGCRVPEDMSVAGFNDSWFSRLMRVPLTTIHLPQEEMAVALMEMLMERIKHGSEAASQAPRRLEAPWRLVIRESTGPAPCAAKAVLPA